MLPTQLCTAPALAAAYSAGSHLGFVQDGLYLVHSQGHYAPGDHSPLALLWKDEQCSRYVLVSHHPLEIRHLKLKLSL